MNMHSLNQTLAVTIVAMSSLVASRLILQGQMNLEAPEPAIELPALDLKEFPRVNNPGPSIPEPST